MRFVHSVCRGSLITTYIYIKTVIANVNVGIKSNVKNQKRVLSLNYIEITKFELQKSKITKIKGDFSQHSDIIFVILQIPLESFSKIQFV